MKTGYTKKSGRTLVSAARRDGMTLICVTLNAPSDWADHTALFDWGFTHFIGRNLAHLGERMGQLPVSGGLSPVCPIETVEDLNVALSPDEKVEVRCKLTEAVLTAPVEAGVQVGERIYYANGIELLRTPLVTGQSIPNITAPKGGNWLWRSVFKN